MRCATFLVVFWALCLRNAWIDSGYMFCPSRWFYLGIFHVKVDSDPEDDSVLFSCGSSSTAVACAILVLLVWMHLVLCSRRFSA